MTPPGRRLSKREAKDQATNVSFVEALLMDLPDTFLFCRDLRHAWSVDNDFHVYSDVVNAKLTVIARDLICMRCGTGRKEVYVQRSWGLEKIRNAYAYADGYQLKGAPRGVTASKLIHDIQYRKTMANIARLERQKSQQTQDQSQDTDG